MKIVAYVSALILALFNAKLVAGAISGIVITPLAKPFERVVVVRKYIVPFFQGIFMGGVALYTARWFLDWVGVELGLIFVMLLAFCLVVLNSILMKTPEERHFHASACTGELTALIILTFHLSLT